MTGRFHSTLVSILLGFAAGGAVGIITATGSAAGAVSMASEVAVHQHHSRATPSGLYLASTLTRAAAGLHRERTFQAPLHGPSYMQPFFWGAVQPGDNSTCKGGRFELGEIEERFLIRTGRRGMSQEVYG